MYIHYLSVCGFIFSNYIICYNIVFNYILFYYILSFFIIFYFFLLSPMLGMFLAVVQGCVVQFLSFLQHLNFQGHV